MPRTTCSAAAVLEEVGVQIDVLDALGGQYARQYFAHALGLKRRAPVKPERMHPLIAKALRDVAADEAMSVRLYGPPVTARATRTAAAAASGDRMGPTASGTDR